MHHHRRALALTIACVMALSAAPSAAGQGVQTVGIADQHGETFADPLFSALGVRHARLNLAWDALQYDWQLAELDSWMAQARAANVQPLVIFSQSRVRGRTRMLPSPAEFTRVVDAIRVRYPWVVEFAAWNEANHAGQPTFRRPDRVAAYYAILKARCAGCRVLPASLLDNRNLVPWTRGLLRELRKRRIAEPTLWGFHNYSDVNYLRDRSTQQLLNMVRGRVWIVESGGVVEAFSPTASRYPQGAPYAARVMRYILGPLLQRNPRIERVYFYQWKTTEESVSWDSGLVAPDGTPRPSYAALLDWLKNPGQRTRDNKRQRRGARPKAKRLRSRVRAGSLG